VNTPHRNRPRQSIEYRKQRGANKGWKKTLTGMVRRAGPPCPAVVSRKVFHRPDYGISRETVYQYLHHASWG
jgi:hypothetical protein